MSEGYESIASSSHTYCTIQEPSDSEFMSAGPLKIYEALPAFEQMLKKINAHLPNINTTSHDTIVAEIKRFGITTEQIKIDDLANLNEEKSFGGVVHYGNYLIITKLNIFASKYNMKFKNSSSFQIVYKCFESYL